MLQNLKKIITKRNKPKLNRDQQLFANKIINDGFVNFARLVLDNNISNLSDSSSFTFSSDEVEQAHVSLEKDGICILKDFIGNNISDKVAEAVKDLARNTSSDTTNNVVYQSGLNGSLNSYKKLVTSPSVVVLKRDGRDEGMYDIFNLNKHNDLKEILHSCIYENDFIKEFCSRKNLKIENINAYLNESITETRGFHADGWKPQYKMLIYLCDVLDHRFGPYCYVPGTHNQHSLHSLNKYAFSQLKTDVTFFNYNDAKLILGPKRSAILSDQVGFHRGFPQLAGYQRTVLMVNFREH